MYFWTWGTVNENFKDVIFDFFSDHQHGERLDSVGMKNYMDAFFELGCFRDDVFICSSASDGGFNQFGSIVCFGGGVL